MNPSDPADSRKTTRRPYHGHVQAEIRDLTRRRIIEAAATLYAEAWIDQITLEQVAERTGVTIQTVLRHFGTKEALLVAAGRHLHDAEAARRADILPSDLDGIIAYLMDHYDVQGDQVLRGLAQEGRYPALAEFMEEGRILHRGWVTRVFDPALAQRSDEDRERLIAQLVAVCDVYTWKLLRRQAGLSREQTALALRELLRGLVGERLG